MALTKQFETQRNLLTGMEYKRGETGVVERFYTYDSLGRPLTRQENRQGGRRSDTFTHNERSELTAATIGSDSYAYAYDNIGNRKTAQENAEEVTNYDANALNQYTAVGEFVPQFDADGNQTRVQTSTGIWDVTYNAENRPTMFSRVNEDGTTTQVTCAYDYMGRRATKKVETLSAPDAETGESTTTLHQRYLYRGYLQIACCDLTRENHPHLWLITWDPTQPVATRPLAIRKDGTWYCYGWDLTKNVCEVFSNEGYLNNTVVYSYTPYGEVSESGDVTQPIQWSSEYHDTELALVYYNYRHYNPVDGRWMGRDMLGEKDAFCLYSAFKNNCIQIIDKIGLECWSSSKAFAHYMLRKGDVTLVQTGCESIVTNATKALREEYVKIVIEKAKSKKESLSLMKSDQPEEIDEQDHKGTHSGVWWIGGFTLYRSFVCSVTCTKAECTITQEMKDDFKDPFDLDNETNPYNPLDWNDHWNPGKIFTVTHTWTENKSV